MRRKKCPCPEFLFGSTLKSLLLSNILRGTIDTSFIGPARSKRGNLGPCPRLWWGVCHGPSNKQLLARFRALPDPEDEGHGVGRGGGRTRTETSVVSHQEGRGQRDADAHAHETTVPFVGRVVGHVRLYGKRRASIVP